MRRNSIDSERGQAYTLEGFVSAIILLTAVLLALQSVVITPTSGGSVDRTVKAQVQQEADDALTVGANDGQLSHIVRYWNETGNGGDGRYYHPNSTALPPDGYYTPDDFADPNVTNTWFGSLINQRFQSESGQSYNVVLTYQNEHGNETESLHLVNQGSGSPEELSAGYTVTLYDDQRLTAPGNDDTTLAEAGDGGTFPIPNVDGDDSEVYNVVEVRIVVW